MNQSEFTALAVEACGWWNADPQAPKVRLALRVWATELQHEDVGMVRAVLVEIRKGGEMFLPKVEQILKPLAAMKRKLSERDKRALPPPPLLPEECLQIARELREVGNGRQLSPAARKEVAAAAAEMEANAKRLRAGQPTVRIPAAKLVHALVRSLAR